MVCAMGGARRFWGLKPRFVCPSRGPLARSPPPPPSASPSTIGTAGGWVACLVLVVLSLRPVCMSYVRTPGMNICTLHKKARHRARHTCSSALRHGYRRPPGAASPPRIPLGGFDLPSWGAAAGCTAAAVRGPKNRHMCSQILARQCHACSLDSRGSASGPFTHSQVA